MVFRPPPMPTRTREHVREANARGVASVPTITSSAPPVTLKWEGSVVDPAWLKAHLDVTRPQLAKPLDLIAKEVEIGLNKALDPEMFEKIHKSGKRPDAMYAFDGFLDSLAELIQDLFKGTAKLENAKVPLNVAEEGMDPDDLAELIRGDLGRLLKGIVHAATLDPMPELEERQLIRSVWEHDIKENSIYCDVTDEEIAELAMDTISDDELMAEASRRGLLKAKLPV